jgi:hypothetical protein
MKDKSEMDDMYYRNPNVTTIIYVLIVITVKFIMGYIFFSLVWVAFIWVEKNKK